MSKVEGEQDRENADGSIPGIHTSVFSDIWEKWCQQTNKQTIKQRQNKTPGSAQRYAAKLGIGATLQRRMLKGRKGALHTWHRAKKCQTYYSFDVIDVLQ